MISATTATSAPVDQPPDLDGIAGLPDGAQLIWAPADRSNYYSAAQRPYGGVARRQIAICFHTSEESWDDYESAPHWFQEARANASTGYYADSDGDLWQMVRDADFAWAQGARTRDLVLPRPPWWRDDYISYNSCMLSIEIEGRAAPNRRYVAPRRPPIPDAGRLDGVRLPQVRDSRRPHPSAGPHGTDPPKARPGPQFPLVGAAERRVGSDLAAV